MPLAIAGQLNTGLLVKKFEINPPKKIHLSEAQASCDPFKIPKLLKMYSIII